jgi:hypothetical protein
LNQFLYLNHRFDLDAGWNCDLFQFTFDAESNVANWERVECDGDTPLARDKFCVVDEGDGNVLLHGGFGPLIERDDDGWGDGQTFHWLGDVRLFSF